MSQQPTPDPNADDRERALLIAENERLRSQLEDHLKLRGSRLIGSLAAIRRSGPARWLRRLGRPPEGGAPIAWSWATEGQPNRGGQLGAGNQESFLALLAEQSQRLITVVHPGWRGVRSSAENLFDCRLYVDTLGETEAVLWAKGLADAGVERVVFQGLPLTHERLVRSLRRHSPQTRLFVIWHGNFMQLGESADWYGLRTVLDWAREGVIERVGFVKQGMAEVFARQGVPTGFLLNYVRRIPDGPSTPMEGGPHLGLWAVEPIWRKLPYTMIAAAALVPGATVWAAGQHRRAEEVAACVGVPYQPFANGPILQTEMPAVLARMHVNLYVTLSECAPMLPLESLAVGVPCLVGPSTTYFADYRELAHRLVIVTPDDAGEISAQTIRALTERDAIISAYRSAVPQWRSRAVDLRDRLLEW